MSEWGELLSIDKQVAANFFYPELRQHVWDRPKEEALYTALVFGSFVQTSIQDYSILQPDSQNGDFIHPLRDLSEFTDQFLLRPLVQRNPGLILNACAQSLHLTGFCRNEMERRYNVKFFEEAGAHFFRLASELCQSPRDRAVFGGISENHHRWALALDIMRRNMH